MKREAHAWAGVFTALGLAVAAIWALVAAPPAADSPSLGEATKWSFAEGSSYSLATSLLPLVAKASTESK